MFTINPSRRDLPVAAKILILFLVVIGAPQ